MNWIYEVPLWAWVVLCVLQFSILCAGYSLGYDQRRQDRKHREQRRGLGGSRDD